MKKCTSFLVSLTLLVALAAPIYAMESRAESNLKGIDVSHWEGTIDWSKVGASGVKFAYLKASEGTSNVDSEFANYVKGARANAIAVGAYHFAKPSAPYDPNEAVNEAVFFVNTMKPRLSNYGDIMPVLDLEENGGLSSRELEEWVRIFTNCVMQATNRQVMLYISEDFLHENGNLNNSLSDLPIWVSYWDQYYKGQNPPDIAGWKEWVAWQYSSQGTVPGIMDLVDLNVGPNSLEDLRGELSFEQAATTATTDPTPIITLQVGSRQAIINGKAHPLDVAPFIAENRSMVPIRFITESMGSKVDWNPDTQEVTITMENVKIVLTYGKRTAVINGDPVILDVPLQLSNGRTFVPLRFISENLGRQINYDPGTQLITIS